MEINLPYKVIRTDKQYYEYADILEQLTMVKKRTKAHQETIDLLTLLIETYDAEHTPEEEDIDPVDLLKSLMKDHVLKSVELAEELGISKSLLSDILHYRRGFSKEIIRKLAERFKLRQEAFNRPYKLLPSSKTSVLK
ncbi:transcriptional regulator [Pseudoflavitalea sp. G-6-1-2]|uniref:helix-turn-helix domain-containing protein n=1 Tax=Pseudoflavitalea sp. G-6-1-2 TaxID=2728841 RepID=UPI00146E7992|nr:helix-turn-helix domain-containing protein [Pseudoflavitalea sp. G-6-1-2]NML20767.1 transcriptional regulator [Pseudoflavitalea sp. G-6-1-2]